MPKAPVAAPAPPPAPVVPDNVLVTNTDDYVMTNTDDYLGTE